MKQGLQEKVFFFILYKLSKLKRDFFMTFTRFYKNFSPLNIIVAIFIAMLILATPPSIADSNEKFIIQYRQKLMVNIQNNLIAMSSILKGHVQHQDHLPDLTLMMNIMAKQTADAFALDTREFSKSGKSKPAIWKNSDDFSKEVQAFIRETTTLNKLAQSNDLQALKAQLGVVGKNCASCHKKFRKK